MIIKVAVVNLVMTIKCRKGDLVTLVVNGKKLIKVKSL